LTKAEEQDIYRLFEEQVQRSPEAIAVTDQASSLTYRHLQMRADCLARYLQSFHVGPEVCVGLCVERSSDMIIGILGILRSGGVYVPLDPQYPQERLAFMLADAQVSLVLTQAHLRQHCAINGVPCISVDDYERADTLPELVDCVAACNAAYSIYTSGSTGRPKGVVIEHHSLASLIIAQRQHFAISADHRLLQFASVSFDASVSEIFLALCAGATLVLLPANDSRHDLAPFLVEQAITTVTLPPSMLAVLGTQEALPMLHTLIVAGETCSAEIFARWGRDGRTLFNAYGPTEATVCCTIHRWHVGDSPRCIGRALPNQFCYVLDEHFQEVPVGSMGMLYIGGSGLARGYHGHADLTAEHFFPDPIRAQRGARMYRSGDLVRSLADGSLEFIGRSDQQVKVRGCRVELGEIEAALLQHPLIQGAVLLLHEESNGDQQLFAYIVEVPNSTDSTSAVALRCYLAALLPSYMIPYKFIYLQSFPLMFNGKIDKQALQALKPLQDIDTEDSETPQSPLEEMLVDIWKDVLSMDSDEALGVYDNFF